jgi:hypothetical protein
VTAVVAVTAAALSAARAGQAADLLLVERPAQLVILDRYQQTVPAQERRRLTPFAPILVKNLSGHLGDGITPCMSVEIDGVPFYLILDDGGELAGKTQAGYLRLVRGAELSADTVEVLATLRFASPDRSRERQVNPGDRLALLFRAGGDSYARLLGGGFGWLPAGGSAWRTIRNAPGVVPAGRHRELEIIRSSINSANAVFVSLYASLGPGPSGKGGAPRWELEAGNDALVCVLTGLSRAGDEVGFAESTEMLARELQTLLLGRGMGVSSRPGVITIRYLNGAQETH